jgi:1-phosphofructokinase family hexose kinase
MILALTLNPAIDFTLSVDRINYDDRAFILNEEERAGGKGVNAAQVIHSYGGDVHAIATRGGSNGDRFAELLAASGIPVTQIPVSGETRCNYAVFDQQGLTIKLDHEGQPLEPQEIEQVREVVCRLLPNAKWLMLTGSLPPRVPADFYAGLIRSAREQQVPTLFDSSGDALRIGLAAEPAIAKPNRTEAERLLDRPLLSQAQAAEAALEIRQMGAQRVILSLGSQGAVAAWEKGTLRAIPPVMATGCPIGAGDVLAATCVWALSRGESFPDALSWAVAAATCSAAQPGITFAPLEEVEQMRARVEMRSL